MLLILTQNLPFLTGQICPVSQTFLFELNISVYEVCSAALLLKPCQTRQYAKESNASEPCSFSRLALINTIFSTCYTCCCCCSQSCFLHVHVKKLIELFLGNAACFLVLLAYLRGIVGAQEGVAALALKCTGLPVHVLHKENLHTLALMNFRWLGSLNFLYRSSGPICPQTGLLALRVQFL